MGGTLGAGDMALHRNREKRRRDRPCPSPASLDTTIVRPDSAGEIYRRQVDPGAGFGPAFRAVGDDWL